MSGAAARTKFLSINRDIKDRKITGEMLINEGPSASTLKTEFSNRNMEIIEIRVNRVFNMESIKD